MDKVAYYKEEALGTRVLIRTNEHEPLIVGKIIRFEEMPHSHIPVVLDEDTGEQIMSCGITLPYDETLKRYLETMTPKEQWEYLKLFVQKFRAIDYLRSGM